MAKSGEAPWVDGLTIGEVLRRTAAKFPDRDAVVFHSSGVRYSYAQLDAEVDRVARALLALGVHRGEHVAVWATNVPQWFLLQFATARIGVILVTINPAYRAFELKYVLRQSDAVALFLVDQFKSSNYYAMFCEVCPELSAAEKSSLRAEDFPKLRNVVGLAGEPPVGAIKWNEFLERGDEAQEDLEPIAKSLKALDPINIQYTSGTTGFPKAAMLSHRNLLLNAFYVGACQKFTENDRLCAPLPFYHCFGCVMGNLCTTVYGAALISPAESFNPTATLDAIETERATSIYGVPTMFIAQLQDPSFASRDLKSLRTGIMAGSPCPIQVMRQVIDDMGVRELTIAYGQTETSPAITMTHNDDPVELRVETVGKPIPDVEVKIVEPATGATLGDNEQGEFCTRGHVVMLGYYNDPEATARTIDPDGWLHTGDLAVRQSNGYFRITGRIKDMIIRGGENIYPREIEEFLFRHPAIEQAAVVGVPDPKFVEETCAWIKLRPGTELTADDVRTYCRSALAHYKTPRHIKFVDAFPQTVTGKIQKFKIRELMIDELGLKVQETA